MIHLACHLRCRRRSAQCSAGSRLLLVAGLASVFAMAHAVIAVAVELQTGAAFRQALQQHIEAVSWSQKPLRGALQRVAESQRVAVMLDRRIDPTEPVEFSASRIPLGLLIEQLALKHEAATCYVGPVVYVGPPQTTELLPTVVEMRKDEVRRLPSTIKARLLRTSPLHWDRLTTPRQVLDDLERQYGVRIVGKENMPHDLWPATQLPPLGFAEKLSLVLAGFHATFELSKTGDAVRLVAMPKDAALERRYSTRGDAARLAEQLQQRYSAATIRSEARHLVVNGRWEVHEAIGRILSGERVRTTTARPPAGAENVYTLTVENKRVGGLLQALGAKLGKTVTFDVQVERRLSKEVSFSVKNVDLDELLSAATEQAGLKYELEGDAIRVFD